MSNSIPATDFSFNNVILDNQELPNTVNLSFLQNENSTPSLSSTIKITVLKILSTINSTRLC